jgi:NAD(P)-dependent dehydrogenase (short-subunit alcohol dehydrogenase family)
VLALMRAVAQEEAKNGVRANALAPSSIRTASNVAAMGKDVSYVEPADLANVVAFLCSPESAAISGQILEVQSARR